MADEESRPAPKAGGIWDFIKEHAAIIGGGLVGVIALYYLVFMQNASSAAAPSTVSFPAQGGGSVSSAPATPAVVPQTPILPFSPDFSVLASITNSGLQSLWSQAFNIETQINAAVIGGQDTSMLYSQLAAIQQQIANYQITPTPTIVPTTFAASVTADQIPGVLSSIWSTYGFEQQSNPTGFAQGWIGQAAGIWNIPTGVATAAWNAIQANPNSYVSQLNYVSAAQQNANIAALINGLLTQYNASPSTFANIPIAPINLGVKNPNPLATAPPTTGGGTTIITGGHT